MKPDISFKAYVREAFERGRIASKRGWRTPEVKRSQERIASFTPVGANVRLCR